MQSALCGSIGGGISAALTTPLDVIKTRMMLGADFGGVHYRGIGDTVCHIGHHKELVIIIIIIIGGVHYRGIGDTVCHIGHHMGRCRVGYVGPVYGFRV